MWQNRKLSHSVKSLLTSLAVALIASAPVGAATKQSEPNNKLLAATGPYEALTEAALGGNAGVINKALKAAEAERAATRGLLAPEAAGSFDKLFAELNTAQAKHDTVAVALQSAELYKLLVSSTYSAALTVPKEVNLLDYSGFRTNGLLKAVNTDWTAVADTAREANGFATTATAEKFSCRDEPIFL